MPVVSLSAKAVFTFALLTPKFSWASLEKHKPCVLLSSPNTNKIDQSKLHHAHMCLIIYNLFIKDTLVKSSSSPKGEGMVKG